MPTLSIGRLSELEALRRIGAKPRAGRRDRWLVERQLLIRGPQRTTAMLLSVRLQLAGFAVCVAVVAGLAAAIAAASWAHSEALDLARQVDGLRRHSRTAAEREVADRTRLANLEEALARSVDRSVVEAEHTRLRAERDAALRARDAAAGERDVARAANRQALQDIDRRARSAIAEMEQLIAATGISPGREARPQAVQRTASRGGPFVPWTGLEPESGGVDPDRASRVESNVERLEALQDILRRLPLASPVEQLMVADRFGFRVDPFTAQPAMHEGVDLRGSPGAAVFATAAGVVIFAGWKSEYGNVVEIDHGLGIVTRYAHLGRFAVRAGQVVARHQQLGEIGSTGRSTGVHLHYEVRVDGRARNPMTFLRVDPHVPQARRLAPARISVAPRPFDGVDGR